MVNPTIEELKELYKLVPHPEGGYYVETYKDDVKVGRDGVVRSASTGIYFLLTSGCVSHIHKIKSSEMWHHYIGESITIVELYDDDKGYHIKKTILGKDVLNGEVVQYTVRPNVWFGSFPNMSPDSQGNYALVGCTVSPGFEFEDFELAERNKIINSLSKDISEQDANLISSMCIQK
ncbi:hypothetical protein AKO1_013158 [Acrasis kona]|uniref:DUF985 domain-containing protein n=1 Tax=Acrasis kona TaxID=1008807 RepID=A0AAW2YZ21_9EUKA